MSAEWTVFPGDGKQVSTTILSPCQNEEYDKHRCDGWTKVDGEFVICVCPCHVVAGSGN